MSEKRTILIIEDSKSFANSLASLVRADTFFEVIIADCYAEAQRILNERHQDIFVAISDLNLPDAADGDSVRLVKEFDIPCIAFTGMFSKALREDVYSLGVCDYVLKQGIHDLTYVARLVRRIYQNPSTTVLVVDDSISARERISALLESQRLKVILAESGAEALKKIKETDNISLVLLDLVMEGMDGLDVLKSIRSSFDVTDMAVIGVSGETSREKLAKFIKYGGNDFILKPIQEEEFFCRVNNALSQLDQFHRLKDLNDKKRQMIGMAAHDIRGPLGAVMTGISLSLKKITDEQVTRLLGAASKGCDIVLDLLNSLLDVTELDQTNFSLDLKPTDLNQLVEDVIEEMSLWLEEKDQTMVWQAKDKQVVEIDPVRFREVLSNLISNAIKYAPQGANVYCSIDSESLDSVVIKVENEGVSIPKSEQNSLFEPFVKLSTRPTGGESSTGLGLSICKKIIEQHQGRISYHEREEGGSVFKVLLPKLQQMNI